MREEHIRGMEVGVVVDGRPLVFYYGEATSAHVPVSPNTLFELGSVSKTLTATLVALAQEEGRLDLSDRVDKHLPSLAGTPFGALTLLSLGTHTPGGLPLQVPEGVRNDLELMAYFRGWRPAFPPGTRRTYGNPGIGILGVIAAKSMGENFEQLMDRRIFSELGMIHSYIEVPVSAWRLYAEGQNQSGQPIRMTHGILADETYGVRATGPDLLRFVQANLGLLLLAGPLQRAIDATHQDYFRDEAMTQDLIWEQYAWPTTLATLLEGNGETMIYQATPVVPLLPPEKPRRTVWINKTGSTNGFGAYVAFIPSERTGIVILANRAFSIRRRVELAYQILTTLRPRAS